MDIKRSRKLRIYSKNLPLGTRGEQLKNSHRAIVHSRWFLKPKQKTMKKAGLILAIAAALAVSAGVYVASQQRNGCPPPSDRPNCHIIPPPTIR